MEQFGIQKIWNDCLIQEQRQTKARNHINASDLGGTFIDRYYKMKGTEPTNPYDTRILKVFAAGNEFHHLIKKVFEKIGILKDGEKYIEIPETKDILKILGYYDMKIGEFDNWHIAKQRIKEYGFSEAIEQISLKLIDYFESQYPQGIEPQIIEVKSINSNAFWSKKDYIGTGYEHHKLQLYTYLKATGINKGTLLYISKDDLTLQEGLILHPNESLEKIWLDDVKTMTEYYRKNIIPPREPDYIFNQKSRKYEVNWRIARSPYLTLISGKSKEDWEKEVKEIVKNKNKKIKIKK